MEADDKEIHVVPLGPNRWMGRLQAVLHQPQDDLSWNDLDLKIKGRDLAATRCPPTNRALILRRGLYLCLFPMHAYCVHGRSRAQCYVDETGRPRQQFTNVWAVALSKAANGRVQLPISCFNNAC